MTINITHPGSIFILRLDGRFVGAYDTMEQVDRVLDAYRGLVR